MTTEKKSTIEHLDEMMRLVGEELSTFANSDVVVGSPIEFSTATVVPISRVSVALAGGGAGGQGEAKVKAASKKTSQGEGAGGASTGVAKIRPVAIIVFTKTKVEVLTIPEKIHRGDRLLELIPEVVGKLTRPFMPRKIEAEE